MSGLSSLFGSSGGQTTAGGNSLIGGVTFRNQTDREEGVTYAVIGEGQVRIGDATGAEVLGSIRRDIDGRQVITLSQHDRTTIDIPLVNLQQLSANATSAANLFRALTTPIPGEVEAQGPAAADYFQRLVARGMSAEEALAGLNDPYIRQQITNTDNLRRAEEFYGVRGQQIPEQVGRLLLSGERVEFGPDGPMLSMSGCTASADLCSVIFNEQSSRRISDAARGNFEAALQFFNQNGGSREEVLSTLQQNALLYAACNPDGWQAV